MGRGDKCSTVVKDNAFTCIVTSISTVFSFSPFFYLNSKKINK